MRKKIENFFRRHTTLFIVLGIFILIFSFLQLSRIQKNGVISLEDSYSLFYASNNVSIHNFSLPASILSFFGQSQLFAIFLLFFLSIGSMILFYSILTNLNVFGNVRLFALGFFTLSSPFIYSFGAYTNYPFILFFILLFSLLYINKKFVYATLSAIPLIFISLPSIIIIFVLIEMLSFFLEKVEKKYRIIMHASLFIISLSAYFLFYFNEFIPNSLFFIRKSILMSTISDFGALIGFGIFNFILSMIGLILFWEKSKKRLPLYISISAAFFLSLIFPVILLVLNLLFCFFAAVAINEIYRKKWEILILKNITLIIILCGIIFSCFSFENRLINSDPLKSEIDALNFLKNKEEGVVLSHEKNGFMISYFSKKPSFVYGDVAFEYDGEEKIRISRDIFYSRNLEKTIKLFKENNIKYVYVDKDMKDGLVFEKRNEGLLFILDKSGGVFEKIYDEDDVEIWAYASS